MRKKNRATTASARAILLAGVLVHAVHSPQLWSAEPPEGKPPAIPADHAARMEKSQQLFRDHVGKLLADRCVKCHGGEATESEFDLTDRDGLLKGGSAGPAVLVGKAKDSLLYKLITHAKDPPMPEDGPRLDERQVALVAEWIDLGAAYDRPLKSQTRREPAEWTKKVLPAEAKAFWSFQPLRRAVPPNQGAGHPIDAFLVAAAAEQGLQISPEADKRTLLRRAYLHLWGLPPSPAEVRAFEADRSPDAYERVIDRLLAGPAYGERFARHWLDLARFGESHGFEHDYDRPTAFHYRDFVIQAFNRDLPFDDFVRWQIAGDEVAPAENLAWMATGFLAAGVHATQITKNEVEKHRYDELDDMLATVGTSMLGLTIGCARCHDHKYDPIPQRDYYQLLSAFTTTVRSEIELEFDKDRYRKARAEYESAHAPFVKALDEYERDVLPKRLATWERSPTFASPWIVLDQAEVKASGGAQFDAREDGSFLASGPLPTLDNYTFTAETDLETIRAVRIEALADPSLAKGGPGRAANGNFALSDVRMTVAPRQPNAGRPAATAKWKNARATFEQKGLTVAAAIDADGTSAWAVDPQFGKDHAAALEIDGPATFPGGCVITLTLSFSNNAGHSIGRPRISIAAEPAPDLRGVGFASSARVILRTPAARRTEEEKRKLLLAYRPLDPEWKRLKELETSHARSAPRPNRVTVLVASEGLPPIRLHSQGEDFFKETYFLRRGDVLQKEAVAPVSFLQVLMPDADGSRYWTREPPPESKTSHRRAALADWLTDVDRGAGALLARVAVNRLWQHAMGRGIVATPSDFGTRGEPPTHPELLDWLASELIAHGWRTKPIQRLILTSGAYRQTSVVDEARIEKDPSNRYFCRQAPRRLEAEAIRDSILAVSGRLDPAMFGPGTLDPSHRRRSIYFTVKRSQLPAMLQVFDAPEPLQSAGRRPTTTIAPQALLLLNNPMVRAAAASFADRVAGDAGEQGSIERAYQFALARSPSEREKSDASAFLAEQKKKYASAGRNDADRAALADFCQVLFCLSEFVYID